MKRGAALLISIFMIGAFLTLAGLFVKIVHNAYAGTTMAFTREQAFYLAEAGLAKGKVELAHNPDWYTDLPYYLSDNTQWLIRYAAGERTDFGEGAYKIVREKGRDRLYSIGQKGQGVVVLKLEFSNPPFKSGNWSEL